jgi:hypothetical protein
MIILNVTPDRLHERVKIVFESVALEPAVYRYAFYILYLKELNSLQLMFMMVYVVV